MADSTNRLGEFLRARRALVTPEPVGLPDAGRTKRIVPPLVGEIVLGYETLRVADAPEQLVVGYHAEPGSASERALALLQTIAAEQAVAPVMATA